MITMRQIVISRPIIIPPSGLSLVVAMVILDNPQITTVLKTSTDSEANTASIVTVLATAVA